MSTEIVVMSTEIAVLQLGTRAPASKSFAPAGTSAIRGCSCTVQVSPMTRGSGR